MFIQYTSNGIAYSEELHGPNGVAIILYPTEKQGKSKIDKAKRELRSQRDIVKMFIADEYDKDELYKSEIFKDKRTKVLKWFEIEQDEKLIRKERKKGTTPEEFVTKFVLPFVKQTKKKYTEKYKL